MARRKELNLVRNKGELGRIEYYELKVMRLVIFNRMLIIFLVLKRTFPYTLFIFPSLNIIHFVVVRPIFISPVPIWDILSR